MILQIDHVTTTVFEYGRTLFLVNANICTISVSARINRYTLIYIMHMSQYFIGIVARAPLVLPKLEKVICIAIGTWITLLC